MGAAALCGDTEGWHCPPNTKNSLEARLPAVPTGISYEWSDEMLCGTKTKSSVSQEEFLLLVLAESLDTWR